MVRMSCFQLVKYFRYHVASDDVLVTEQNLLSGKDGGLGPGAVSCFGCFNGSFHFISGRQRNPGYKLKSFKYIM